MDNTRTPLRGSWIALASVESADFFYAAQADDDVFADQLSENPVWQELQFVRDGRVYSLGGDTWLFGGPLSAGRLVDRVTSLLTGAD